MGSCISKCKPRKKSKEEDSFRHVHDKLVIISKDPPPSAPEITVMPRSPAPSAASSSSFSYSANKSATASSISSSSSLSSSSSSSSYASSVLKDRSFSNDFLWSCVKENPHVIGLHEKSLDSKNVMFPNKIHPQNPTPLLAKKKQQTAVQEKTTSLVNAATTPKKRARASSPTLVRQKSFRKEQSFAPSRGLRSPSPSRRFNGESNRIFPVKENYYSKPAPVSRGSNAAVSSAPRRGSFRAPTPSRKRELSVGGEHSERRNDELLRHISSKVDGKEIDDDVVMEDINNPLIALDCFIFL